MPYTIHTAKAKIKDSLGTFRSIDVFSNEENLTINATLSQQLSIGGGWVDITLDKTNAEILAAAPLGRMVINIPFGGQTITCRQTSYTNNAVFFNGMMINSAIYVFAVTIMQSTAQASLIGTMAGPQ